MSNIGKQRILVPENLSLKCRGWKVYAKGKNGEFTINFPRYTQFTLDKNYLSFRGSKISASLYGSLQRKLKILIYGLSLEYVKYLKFVGVGYRARIEKNLLILRLGHSHEIFVQIPENLNISIFKRNNIKISGSNFEDVSQFSYKIRSYRPPEPFKGKGVVCLGEEVRRKEGKKKKN